MVSTDQVIFCCRNYFRCILFMVCFVNSPDNFYKWSFTFIIFWLLLNSRNNLYVVYRDFIFVQAMFKVEQKSATFLFKIGTQIILFYFYMTKIQVQINIQINDEKLIYIITLLFHRALYLNYFNNSHTIKNCHFEQHEFYLTSSWHIYSNINILMKCFINENRLFGA